MLHLSSASRGCLPQCLARDICVRGRSPRPFKCVAVQEETQSFDPVYRPVRIHLAVLSKMYLFVGFAHASDFADDFVSNRLSWHGTSMSSFWNVVHSILGLGRSGPIIQGLTCFTFTSGARTMDSIPRADGDRASQSENLDRLVRGAPLA